jgi:serralysin
MAAYVFESMTNAQAGLFNANDTLRFSTPSLSPSTVIVSSSDNSADQTTLTAAGKSLTFSGIALTGAKISFASSIAANSDAALQLGSVANDTIIIDNAHDGNVVYGLSGNDTIRPAVTSMTTNVSFTIITYANVPGANSIYGGGGEDSIIGSASGDHIYGYGLTGAVADDGNDTIYSSGGNDYIQGNGGDDNLDGGDGNDRLNGGSGNDTITGGFTGNDTINGNKGDDFIKGDTGNDSLRGGADDDRLEGGSGNDILLGDLGNDMLLADDGIDVVMGGPGQDRFYFGAGTARDAAPADGLVDMITDFTDGEDRVGLISVGQGNGNILYAAPGVVLSSLNAAASYAKQILDAHTGLQDLAVLQVGSDTYLFYNQFGLVGTAITDIVKLANFSASDFTVVDLVPPFMG